MRHSKCNRSRCRSRSTIFLFPRLLLGQPRGDIASLLRYCKSARHSATKAAFVAGLTNWLRQTGGASLRLKTRTDSSNFWTGPSKWVTYQATQLPSLRWCLKQRTNHSQPSAQTPFMCCVACSANHRAQVFSALGNTNFVLIPKKDKNHITRVLYNILLKG